MSGQAQNIQQGELHLPPPHIMAQLPPEARQQMKKAMRERAMQSMANQPRPAQPNTQPLQQKPNRPANTKQAFHAPHEGPCNHHHGSQQPSHPHHHRQPHSDIDPSSQPASHYFKQFRKSWSNNRLFFFRQLLTGNAFHKLLDRCYLSFLHKIDLTICKNIFMSFMAFATGDCLPDCLRPFLAGMFLPLVILWALNYNYLTENKTPDSVNQLGENALILGTYVASMVLFTCVAIRGGGDLRNTDVRKKTRQLLDKKPYLKNGRAYCQQCQIIKGFRSMHCPACKRCIPKFTKHSMVFNQCIGATNELLYLLFCLSVVIAELVSLGVFFVNNGEKIAVQSKIVFSVVNVYVLYLAGVDFLQMLVFNLTYNITEFEVTTWMHQPYLIAFTKREFHNPLDQGFFHNARQSIMNMLSLSEPRKDPYDIIDQQQSGLSASQASSSSPQSTLTNWSKTIYYSPAQIPTHPNRREIHEQMQMMEGKMMEQWKIMEEVRRRVTEKWRGKATKDEIEFQVRLEMQQEMQRRMQEEMRKMMAMRGMPQGMPPGMMMPPGMRPLPQQMPPQMQPHPQPQPQQPPQQQSAPNPPSPPPIVPTSQPQPPLIQTTPIVAPPAVPVPTPTTFTPPPPPKPKNPPSQQQDAAILLLNESLSQQP